MRGGEEHERIAVSRKPFRELSCNSNVRTNQMPEHDRRIVCVKLKDDIHSTGENRKCKIRITELQTREISPKKQREIDEDEGFSETMTPPVPQHSPAMEPRPALRSIENLQNSSAARQYFD